MKTKVLFLMALLCLVVGKVSAYDWQGNEVSTSSDGFYLYNVGFKAFLKNDGSMQENPGDASKWVFESTTEGKIHCGGQYMYFYLDWGSYKAGVKDNGNEGGITTLNHKTTMTIATGTTTGSYHFSYDPATAEVRYFNIDNASGNMTAAKTTGADNDWLLITQAQVDEYNKQAESWHNATVAAGDYYLYNPYFGKYLGISGTNVTLVEGTANAGTFTLAKSGNAYTIKNGNLYLYDKKGSDFGLNGTSVAWTFTSKLGGYQIHGKHNDNNDRYLYGKDDNSVLITKDAISNIKTSIWVLISAEEFNQKSESVSATLNVGAGKFGTFCAPFAVTIPEGVDAYTVSSVDATNAVQMTKIAGTTIEAKTPVLVYSTNGEKKNYTGFKGTDATCTTESNLLVGLLNNTTVPEGAYILTTVESVQKFRKLTQESTGVAYRCYLNWDGPEAKLLNIGNEDATAINAISALVSDKYEAIYTANGAKVNSLQKGLNLVKMADGSLKKIMVK